MRNGLSYSMTIVIVGVILITTAYSVITLSQGGIGTFFEGIGGQQDDRVEAYQIRQACKEVREDVEQSYCSEYVETAEYGGSSWTNNVDCSDTQQRRQMKPDNPEQGDKEYGRTATSAQCDWTQNYRDSDVTVQGNDYNCIEEGFIESSVCPVQ